MVCLRDNKEGFMAGIMELAQALDYLSGPGSLKNAHPGGGGVAEIFSGMQEGKQKKMKSDTDMYQTLREAGYSPQKAFDAVQSGKFPQSPGGDTLKEQKAGLYKERVQAQTEDIKSRTEARTKNRSALQGKIIEKIINGAELSPGEQKIYDDLLKRKSGEGELDEVLSGPKINATREQIMKDMSEGKELTPGAQKIYNEVIKKTGKTGGLEETLQGKNKQSAGNAGTQEMVAVVAPDGRRGMIPKIKLQSALKAGYRLR